MKHLRLLLALPGLLAASACGDPAARDLGFTRLVDTDQASELTGGAAQLTQADSPGVCGTGFEACGGLLAGLWRVQGSCNDESRERGELQRWGLEVLGLDPEGCPDAVQSVTTRWSGELLFNGADAIDQRVRIEDIELELSRSCLNATYQVSIRPEKLAAVCATLSSSRLRCSATPDACLCSARREEQLDTAAVYGVFGVQVAMGPNRPPSFHAYCVKDDLLLWEETPSRQHVLLRRLGLPPYEADPAAPLY
jgi:hypothetical protein